eukprot:356470-Pyramimonas_sp.AAC.3
MVLVRRLNYCQKLSGLALLWRGKQDEPRSLALRQWASRGQRRPAISMPLPSNGLARVRALAPHAVHPTGVEGVWERVVLALGSLGADAEGHRGTEEDGAEHHPVESVASERTQQYVFELGLDLVPEEDALEPHLLCAQKEPA